ARKFAISARYVRQLFAEQGTSFSDYVTDRRLAHIHGCLSDPRQVLRPIGDIAFEAGFIEPSTFYRQFRRRYRMTPSDVRRHAIGAPSGP
ncbi:MAG: helix-turn-helix domain-containing protein, partial [Alphaproteobacteria bacterium]